MMASVLTVLALGGLCVLPQEPAPIPAPLHRELPALREQGRWRAGDAASADPAWPVGNGIVFALLGGAVGEAPANTLHGLCGPDHGRAAAWTPDGDFGACRLQLVAAGTPVALPQRRIVRVRGAGMLVSEDLAPGGLALRTLVFAVPDQPELLRLVEVTNHGAGPAVALTVTTGWPEAVAGDGPAGTATLVHTAAGGATACLGWSPPPPQDLPPGASFRFAQRLRIAADQAAPPPPAWQDATDAATACLAHWRERLRETLRLESDAVGFVDLLEGSKIDLLARRDAATGAVLALPHHRRALLRDLGGPLLLFLRHGLFAEARDLLRLEFAAACRTGRLPQTLPLDAGPAPSAPAGGWDALEVPAGDLGAWVVLHHYWYLRATRDAATIRAHWPLLEACVKRMPRTGAILLPFHGTEPWGHGALFGSLPAGETAAPTLWPADDPSHGRRAWSYASAVLFVQAVAAIGGMQDLLDRLERPAAWRDGAPEPRPGAAWSRRSIGLLHDLEAAFWLADERRFAAALSPLDLTPHRPAQTDAGLLPGWIGMLSATGDRAVQHLRHTTGALWRQAGRIGSSPATGTATALGQAMLLTVLTHFDGPEQAAAMLALRDLADAAGHWSMLHDESGTALPGAPSPFADGVAGDALLYAVSGLRVAASPGIDEDWLRLRVHLPPDATWCNLRNMRHDGARFDLFVSAIRGPLDAEERAANAALPAERRRDPEADQLRLRFALEAARLDDAAGWRLAVVHCAGTQFQEYLKPGEPMVRTEFVGDAGEGWLAAREGTQEWRSAPAPLAPDTDLLVLACRSQAAAVYADPRTRLLDTGLPGSLPALEALLADASPARLALRLDHGWDRAGPITFRTRADRVAALLAIGRWGERGGKVLVDRAPVGWERETAEGWVPVASDAAGALLVADGRPFVLRARVETAADAILRLGAATPLHVHIDGGEPITLPAAPPPLEPDQHALPLPPHPDHVTVEIRGEGPGPQRLFVRVSDRRGRPID